MLSKRHYLSFVRNKGFFSIHHQYFCYILLTFYRCFLSRIFWMSVLSQPFSIRCFLVQIFLSRSFRTNNFLVLPCAFCSIPTPPLQLPRPSISYAFPATTSQDFPKHLSLFGVIFHFQLSTLFFLCQETHFCQQRLLSMKGKQTCDCVNAHALNACTNVHMRNRDG